MSERPELPTSIEEIAETIGVRLALKLVQKFGGLEVQFPARPHDQHPIILELGKEDGYAICKYMGGNSYSVPHCRPPRNARAAVARLEAEGLSRAEIARRLGLTQRHVRRVANAPPTKQLSLFPDEP
jgi:hypothetical protein